MTNDISGLVALRKKEFDGYRKGLPPPQRFMTRGACGPHFLFPQLLDDLDLLKELEVSLFVRLHVLVYMLFGGCIMIFIDVTWMSHDRLRPPLILMCSKALHVVPVW